MGPPAEQVLGVLGNSGLTASYHRTRFVQIGSMAGPNITLPAEILRARASSSSAPGWAACHRRAAPGPAR
ncbi:hypothetical protein MFAL_00150 [Mycolicibacterium fallax]|nr:hypothetical protein MFAL_00150 [Mycolicibacterium fallax]